MAIDLSRLTDNSSYQPISPLPTVGEPKPAKTIDFQPEDRSGEISLLGGEGTRNPLEALGQALFGGSKGGGIPVISDVGHALVHDLGGGLLNKAADIAGSIPTNIGDAGAAAQFDINKYSDQPDGALQLLNETSAQLGENSLAPRFQLLGKWQQLHDPESFAVWQQVLAKAQADPNKAGEQLSDYLRAYGVYYADQTSSGLEGYYDVAPELAMAPGGSFGQSLIDVLRKLTVPQRKAEVGAAAFKGALNQSGGYNPDIPGRLNELLNSDPATLTQTEGDAVTGLKYYGWTYKHALDYLVAHGEGYSSDPKTQIGLSVALDPLAVAQLGASAGATSAARAFLPYEHLPPGALNTFQRVARGIGTTTHELTQNATMGPILKTARLIIDPLSAFGHGAAGKAAGDTLATISTEGFRRGYGEAAVRGIQRLASKFGKITELNESLGAAAANGGRNWLHGSFVENGLRSRTLDAGTALDPEALLAVNAKNLPKDAATRAAGYFQKIKAFDLRVNAPEYNSTIDRVAKFFGVTPAVASDEMLKLSSDELAVLHTATYHAASTEFDKAKALVSEKEWGSLAPRASRLVLGNPTHMTQEAAEALREGIVGVKGTAKKIELWNDAAKKYTNIADMGEVPTGMRGILDKKLATLERQIEDQRFNREIPLAEFVNLPEGIKDFFARFTTPDGRQLWNAVFRPADEHAFGLAYDAEGEAFAEFAPNIGHVTSSAPFTTPGRGPATDWLGNITKGKSLELQDNLLSAFTVARDAIAGDRLLQGIEQKFIKNVKSSEDASVRALSRGDISKVFKMTREAAITDRTTIAGLTPDRFWEATEDVLKSKVHERVAKRALFSELMDAAGGDLRLIGLSSGMAQRIRSFAVAHGLPGNELGRLTIGAYQMFRYEFNPTFFIQAPIDGPWFNIFRGIMPVGGGALKPGSRLFRVAQITQAMGHSGIARDFQLDFADRRLLVDLQEKMRIALFNIPGVNEGLVQRSKNWLGQLALNNQLAYIHAQLGEVVFDSLEKTRALAKEEAARATNPEAKAMWEKRLDTVPFFEDMMAETSRRLGKVANKNDVGLEYLSEIIDDSRLAVKTPEGLLNFDNAISKGETFVDTSVGKLMKINEEYLPHILNWANIDTVTDLRKSLADGAKGIEGGHTVKELTDTLLRLGKPRSYVERVKNTLTFQFDEYFRQRAIDLGMTKIEMQKVQNVIVKSAKLAGMSPNEYITQVLPLAERGGIDGEIGAMLQMIRLSGKNTPEALDALTRVVTGSLHPSAKLRLLEEFEQSLPRRIQAATDAGNKVEMDSLQKALEDLRGVSTSALPASGIEAKLAALESGQPIVSGWSKAADAEFRDLVLRVAAGTEESLDNDVLRIVRHFSAYLQEPGILSPKQLAGDAIKQIIKNIPTDGAAPYHFTQAMIVQAFGEGIRLASKDAIRLAQINTERTVAERTLNHPLFGLYPTSYMWGKVLPETVRFLAKNPFGLETGAAATVWHDVAESVGAQREYDPGFDALYKKLGRSAVIGFLSYLTPGMTWDDMKSRVPPFVESMMRSGEINGQSLWNATKAQMDMISPERWARGFMRAINDKTTGTNISEFLGANELQNQISQGGATPAGSAPPPLNEPLKGTQLAPVLVDDLQELTNLLLK